MQHKIIRQTKTNMKIFPQSLKSPVFLSVIILLIVCVNACKERRIPELSIVTYKNPGSAVNHGVNKLTDALKAKKIKFEKVLSIDKAKGKTILLTGLAFDNGRASQMLKAGGQKIPEVPEALLIWKTALENKQVWIIYGFDDRGLMYGLLDVTDRIRWSTDRESPMSEVREIIEKPAVKERAISIYTMNRTYWESRFYDEKYWARYLDLLAQNRFNSLVVIFGYSNGGFLAPCYPYFFDVDGFPGVRMIGMTQKEQKRNLIAFNKLIKMTHDRGIRFTVGIWDHIYRGDQGENIQGTNNPADKPIPGTVLGVTDENLIQYSKAALSKFVQLIPELDAIQFRMHSESGLKIGEQDAFWADIFRMIKKTSPQMHLDLRAKGLPESVVQSAIDIGVNFRITTKYWMEQMGMPFHPTQVNPDPDESPRRHSYANMLRYPKQYNMIWRLWNGGTSRILLWGDPEYARRFAESTHLYDGDGFEVNEPLATKMQSQPFGVKSFDLLNPPYRYYDYEFERYWHFFQVFGRIGYNPDTPPEVWQKEFELRFGKNAAPFIEEALHRASAVMPRIVASCFPYSGFPMVRGWAEKQPLGNLPEYAGNEGSDIQQFANFDEEARLLVYGGETVKTLPSVNSRWFEQTSDDLNKLILEAENTMENNRSKEFNSTITDLKIISNLALFHSRRIPAAVSYRIFLLTHEISVLDDAIAFEKNAIEDWKKIVASAGDVYAADLIMGLRRVNLCGHWRDELISLEKGLVNLEQERKDLKPAGRVKSAPHYRFKTSSDNNNLFEIAHRPVTSAPAGKPITINLIASNHSGIKWVKLSYRNVNQELEYKTVQMFPDGKKDSYQVTIPAEEINPKWDFMYFLKIMDNKGNGIIYPDLNKETPYIFVKLIR
jgi:hypothetical protein